MRTFTAGERRDRLARRHFLLGDGPKDITAVTAAMDGLHATDSATPYLSLWARVPGFAVDDLDRQLYETRSFVKHLAMRRTLWVLAAVTCPRFSLAASDRVADNERRLLPRLDVTTVGWLDRGWYLGEHRASVFDRTGNAGPTAWWNGRVVGGWYQDSAGRVELQLLEDPGRDGRKALFRKASDLTEWLAGTRISPRFPSPLSKGSG